MLLHVEEFVGKDTARHKMHLQDGDSFRLGSRVLRAKDLSQVEGCILVSGMFLQPVVTHYYMLECVLSWLPRSNPSSVFLPPCYLT